MPDTREKLFKLMESSENPAWWSFASNREMLKFVDYLIANGVTFAKDNNDGCKWIPVTERLPENEKDVLICAERWYCGVKELDKKKVFVTAVAFHTDGKTNTEDSAYTWDLDFVNSEYDEEADAFIVPEGWWESVRYGEEFAAVDDFVTHWMPIPQPPKGE